MNRKFKISQVLSHYTGYLMCELGELYEIANFLSQDSLFTHQLPRASRDAQPWMLESLPWLNGITLEEVTPENYAQHLQFYSDTFGAYHDLSPIPHAAEFHRNPIAEADELIPGGVIVLDL